MAIRNIRYDGDDILRKVCRPVEKMDDRTLTLIDDMFDTMYEANGVGLAAPQVGILKRIVVIDVGDDNPLCLINPVITESDGEQTGEEGCLSLPGKFGTATIRISENISKCCESIQYIRCSQRAVYIPASRKSGGQSSGAGDRHRTVHPNQEGRLTDKCRRDPLLPRRSGI